MTNRTTAVLTPLVVLWAAGYGGLRAWWAAGHLPHFAPLGADLLVATRPSAPTAGCPAGRAPARTWRSPAA